MIPSLLEPRLAELERRMDAVEFALRRQGAMPWAPPAVQRPIERRAEAPPVTPPPLVREGPVIASPPIASPVAPALPYARPVNPTAAPESEFEKTIGLKWAGWAGAIVFVIGAALGVKYAYDQGWLTDLIPNWLWLSLIALVGLALIAAGEWVYRRVHALAAVGLFGAGVATLFVASYTGQTYFEVYSSSTAYVLMVISALVGSAVAMRGNLTSIAVLSLIGANLAPILLGNPNSPLAPFLTYLLAIQCVALFLAAWGNGGKWWTLRGLSLAIQCMWMITLYATHHRTESIVLFFTILFAALYHGELIFTNLRRSTKRYEGVVGLVFGVLVTAALTGGILWIKMDAAQSVQAMWVIALAGAAGIVASALSLLKRENLVLVQSYASQAIALLIVAVPVGLSGMNVEIGWALMAVLLGVIACISRKTLPGAAALVAWMLAAVHMVYRFGNERHPAEWTILNVDIPHRVAWAMGMALLGQVVAMLTATRAKESLIHAARIVAGVAIVLWCGAVMLDLPAAWATFCIIGLGWLLLLEDSIVRSLNLRFFSAALLVLSTVRWLVLDTFIHRFSPAWNGAAQMVMLNFQMLNAGLLIASAMGVLWAMREDDAPTARSTRALLRVGMAIIGLVGLGFEIDRWFQQPHASTIFARPYFAEQMALSIFFACFAVAAVGVGFRLPEKALRYFGLLLLGGAMLKVVFIDLSGISQGYRVLSFIALGLLMLGTSVLYGKLSPKLLSRQEQSEPAADERG